MLKQQIQEKAAKVLERVIADRRTLHASPELSFMEHGTASFVKRRLDDLGVRWEAVAGTGVIAEIDGELEVGGRKTIGLRADMDALPIQEQTGLPFASTRAGIMHACGHDAHTASLLGVAAILQEMRNEFAGTVRLLFQPAEEKLPGGAQLMIRDGALNAPNGERARAGAGAGTAGKLDAMIGQHVMPFIPSGKIGLRKGVHMASMDEITVRIKGKGGHAAMPHQLIDPVPVACQIVSALQAIVSRMTNPLVPCVLSFGRFIADGAINIIPDEVYLEGTFRTLDETVRAKAHVQMKEMAEGIAASFGATCEFNILVGYPVLSNEPALTGSVEDFAIEYVGAENITYPSIWMAAEDFAYYGRELPACFYLLGVGHADETRNVPLHNPRFDLNEEALALSSGLMAYVALRQLGNQ